MNRRNFFKNLGIGLAAAPALTDVILCAEPAYNALDLADMPANPAWTHQKEMFKMHREMLEHIANTNPYANLLQKETFGA